MSEGEKEIVSPEELLNVITNKEHKKRASKPDILAYGKEHVKKLQTAGQIGNSIVYTCTINKLERYANTSLLSFEEVNYAFIEKFNTTLWQNA